MRATALAAFGRLDEAEAALASAERGPAWDAAREHRLLVEVLVATFRGELDDARIGAARLAAFPLPDDAAMRERLEELRRSISALARAFSHQATPADAATLERAAEDTPLVHWAMRYGAAVAAVDGGDVARARVLLEGAPAWPAESAFRAFQAELDAKLAAPPAPLAAPPAGDRG
jgi:hypothetical protein